MSQMLQLDALVMAMACLSTTQTDLGGGLMVPPSLENANSSSCPVSAISGLTTRMQSLSRDIASIKEQIGSLQEQLVDLRRGGSPPVVALAAPNSLGSRFLDLEPQLLATVGAVGVPTMPANCLKQQHGVVLIRPRSNVEPFFVYCHQKVRDGGWTMVVNRYDGSADFNRKWADYKTGFGPLTTEFFIGLDKLHQITSSDNYELLVELQNRKQDLRYALYDHFSIGSESEQYRLNVLGKHQGDAADALRQHTGKKFSTYDQDNDESEQNCAAQQSAAFWYAGSCNLSNPFGLYQRLLERDVDGYKGILWRGFLDGPKGSLKSVRMLVRPRAIS
ncbi:microfibril-associated glycoprotein 4 isoform X2 [Drosophila eugracilis]|uniref:microfibril-associated glycoprotein 4 isoform X2 n=1 Tax=Drosophila eugracilis TaxID=29029 RepID=UPI0007E86CCE|nr:microfibril-associated glycoprotein 4 isoform X2 [Drosophila eugracilis]